MSAGCLLKSLSIRATDRPISRMWTPICRIVCRPSRTLCFTTSFKVAAKHFSMKAASVAVRSFRLRSTIWGIFRIWSRESSKGFPSLEAIRSKEERTFSSKASLTEKFQISASRKFVSRKTSILPRWSRFWQMARSLFSTSPRGVPR